MAGSGWGMSMAGVWALLSGWWRGAHVCIELPHRAVPPLTVLLKRLRLHHLTAVATHHQVKVVVSRVVTEDWHICQDDRWYWIFFLLIHHETGKKKKISHMDMTEGQNVHRPLQLKQLCWLNGQIVGNLHTTRLDGRKKKKKEQKRMNPYPPSSVSWFPSFFCHSCCTRPRRTLKQKTIRVSSHSEMSRHGFCKQNCIWEEHYKQTIIAALFSSYAWVAEDFQSGLSIPLPHTLDQFLLQDIAICPFLHTWALGDVRLASVAVIDTQTAQLFFFVLLKLLDTGGAWIRSQFWFRMMFLESTEQLCDVIKLALCSQDSMARFTELRSRYMIKS